MQHMMHKAWQILYLDDREHSFVIVWVGLNLKALCGISVNYRIESSPCSCGWVISVDHGQVDHHTRRALIYIRLKLRRQTDKSPLVSKTNQKYLQVETIKEQGLGQRGDSR